MKIVKLIKLLVILMLLVFIYAYLVEPNVIQTEYVEIPKSEKTKSLSGLKIVIFSDTHLGYKFDSSNLKRVVNKINDLEPDIILFAGDLVDDLGTFNEEQLTASILKDLNDNAQKVAVFGNHDHGSMGTEKYKQILEQSNFTVLNNQGITLNVRNNQSLRLYGLDDLLIGNQDFSAADEFQGKDLYTILLSHESDVTIPTKYSELFNLQVSGHSHGGQIKFPFIGSIYTPYGAKHYKEGLYKRNQNFVYVTRGLGTTQVPFRFLSKPELTLISFN